MDTTPPIAPTPELPAAEPTGLTGWQPLPARAALLAAAGSGFWTLVPVLGAVAVWWHRALPWLGAVAASGMALALLSAVLSYRRQRRTDWQFDGAALGLRRQLLWQADTRIPVSRVQHLDLRRGPLQRMAGLATLVVHTAGSRFNAVAITGLDQRDAERLRDRLARQIDLDDDAL